MLTSRYFRSALRRNFMFDLNRINFDKIIEIVKDAAKLFADDTAAAHIKEKGLSDYVTEVDMKVQKTLYEKLFNLYPDIQFMGEEKENNDIDFEKPVWILDPVDGTTNLIHRFPGSCISLGLAFQKEVLAGIVYNPYYDELFFARKGHGAFLNGAPIHVHPAPLLSESLISAGTSPYRHDLTDSVFRQIQNVFLRAQDIRRIGSAAIELCYVACGRTDAYFELILKPWDFAAGMIILLEAGGKVTDYSGAPVSPEHSVSMLATNGRIHEELLEVLNSH